MKQQGIMLGASILKNELVFYNRQPLGLFARPNRKLYIPRYKLPICHKFVKHSPTQIFVRSEFGINYQGKMFKIPIVDEVVRSVQSLGDAVTGNPERARDRWRNWADDSVLGTAGQTVGLTVASGATAMVGQTKLASNLIEKAGEKGEKLGATTMSAACQVGGIGAQIVTLGIPNPVSGALNEGAAGMNKVIDKGAKEGAKHLDWDKLGKETAVGLAKGAVSSGGIIPYTGKLVENEIRKDFGEELSPEQERIDHGEEWGNVGLNVGISLLTIGTVKGTGSLVNAGAIGAKRAATLAVASGTIAGIGSGLISKEINSGATRRKMEAAGYRFVEIRCDSKTRKSYAIYSKKDEKDVFVPLPDFGDILGQGLLQGITTGVTAGQNAAKLKAQQQRLYEQTGLTAQEVKTLPKDSMEYQAYKQVGIGELKVPPQQSSTFGKWKWNSNRTDNRNARTGSTVSVTESTKHAWETQRAAVIADRLQMEGKWVKITSKSAFCDSAAGKAMKILKQNNEVLLLEHSTPQTGYGLFSNAGGASKLAHVLKSTKGDIHSVGLLGCEVTQQFAQELATQLKVKVHTLPLLEGSRLHIDANGNFHYGKVFDYNSGFKFQFLSDNNTKYMDVHMSGNVNDLPKAMTQVYNPL